MGVETLVVSALATSLASTGVGTYFAIQDARVQGEMAENAARYQAQVARNQAAMSRQSQNQAEVQAEIAEEDVGITSLEAQRAIAQQQQETRREMGGFFARQGASGAGVSPLARRTLQEIAYDQSENLATQGRLAIGDAARFAAGLRQQAVDFENAALGFDTNRNVAQVEQANSRIATGINVRNALFEGLDQGTSTFIGAAQNPHVLNWMKKRGRK